MGDDLHFFGGADVVNMLFLWHFQGEAFLKIFSGEHFGLPEFCSRILPEDKPELSV